MRLRAGLWRRSRIDSPQSALPGNAHGYASKRDQEDSMLDVVMLALGLGFFAVAVGYTYACERL
jgi:hypothetical protein